MSFEMRGNIELLGNINTHFDKLHYDLHFLNLAFPLIIKGKACLIIKHCLGESSNYKSKSTVLLKKHAVKNSEYSRWFLPKSTNLCTKGVCIHDKFFLLQ